jgi:Uma2 family endonuclease
MSVEIDALDQEPTRPLLREEYDALVEAGFLEDEPVELIEGRLVIMSPEGAPHSAAITSIGHTLALVLGERAWVRTGHPFAASNVSEPEPDVCVVRPGDYWKDHPQSALLVIEVAFSSIRKDRMVKPRVYAAAGVPEYWIVDLNSDTVTILRDPTPVGYATAQDRARGQSIGLLAFPDVVLDVDSFLPPPT